MMHLRAYQVFLPTMVLLGILAFSVADNNMLYIAIAIPVLIAGRLLNSGAQATPLPRWAINAMVLVATLFMALRWDGNFEKIIIVVCQFMVLLQLIKLFEPARPRDEAQLILLSIMLVIGSTLTSASADFGLLLLLFFPVALWTTLLYQLHAGHTNLASHAGTTAPAVGSHSKSDFRLVALVTGVLIIALTAGVFVAMPRGLGTGGSMLANWANPARNAPETGFSNQVKLGSSGLLSESTRIVLEMRIESKNDPTASKRRHLLRGAVLNYYDSRRGEWRSTGRSRRRMAMEVASGQSRSSIDPHKTRGVLPGGNIVSYTQHIKMRVPVMRNLFTLWRPAAFTLNSSPRMFLVFDNYRGLYTTRASGQHPNLSYTVVSTPQALSPDRRYRDEWIDQKSSTISIWAKSVNNLWGSRSARFKDIPLSIYSSTEPELGSEFAANPFARTRVQELAQGILDDRRIDLLHPGRNTYDAAATAFKLYLQNNFTYTTEMIAPAKGQDPIEMFLFDSEIGGRGHCEYFASAMAAMCLSVGIPARVVTGYVASETDGAGTYIVRENHAHAWAEVEIRPGQWVEADPSPPADVDRLHTGGAGLMARFHNVFKIFQIAWVRNIVTYDRDAQTEALDQAKQGPLKALQVANQWVGNKLLGELDLENSSPTARLGATARSFISVFALATALALAFLVAVSKGPNAIRRLIELVSRSERSTAPLTAQQRAIRALHQQMLTALGKLGLTKSPSMPALAHAQSIAQRDEDLGRASVRLASLYSEARFSGQPVDDSQVTEARTMLDVVSKRCRQLARQPGIGHNGAHAHAQGSATA